MLEEDADKAGFFDKKIGEAEATGPSYFTQGTSSLWSTDGFGKEGPFEGSVPTSPHEGLFYVLPYLLLKDLLSVEQVCRSLKDAVSCDVLLWQHLKIDHSLNTKLTDEALLKLAARSQGRLQSLMLVECLRISDEAIEQVVASNPMLSRILLPGCIRISVDAVVRMVEFLERGRSQGLGVKQIKIRGLSGVTKDNLERLQMLLDERAIDVEACPRCKQPRAVFDCTRDKCRDWKALKIPQCRGCIFCISRCEDCGMCIDDTDYEETFCLRLLCSDCWLRLPKCLECNRPGCESSSDYFIRRPDAIFVCPDCQGAYKNGAGLEFYVI
ncbi:hypothetical protein SELMODRAFT_98374 [Selaginella moellendorffii]|uniref:F-box domain-containing protein n=1 Tax=Selaginella moellendorffii TaxID=88036 RepID=D8RNV8_SELML|nr:hypothetical protein SELMODRAFT_98374 [Selaginella moellendorffii]